MRLTQLLEQVGGWQREFDQLPQPAADETALAKLRDQTKRELGLEVPADYLALLAIANGVDWNGFVVYAAQTSPIAGRESRRPRMIGGLLESNRAWRDLPALRDTLVVAESGDALYVLDTEKHAWQTRDRASQDVIATHASFAAMLAAALDTVKPPAASK